MGDTSAVRSEGAYFTEEHQSKVQAAIAVLVTDSASETEASDAFDKYTSVVRFSNLAALNLFMYHPYHPIITHQWTYRKGFYGEDLMTSNFIPLISLDTFLKNQRVFQLLSPPVMGED